MDHDEFLYRCRCNKGFDSYQGYCLHIAKSKTPICQSQLIHRSNLILASSNTKMKDIQSLQIDEYFSIQHELDDNDSVPYDATFNQQRINEILDLPHDHPDRVNLNIGDDTYITRQKIQMTKTIGEQCLYAEDEDDFKVKMKTLDTQHKNFFLLNDFATKHGLSRAGGNDLLQLFKTICPQSNLPGNNILSIS